MPSIAEYCAIGETTTRFLTCMSRSSNGENSGGAVNDFGNVAASERATRRFHQPSTSATKGASRSRRFSCVICLERDKSE